MKPRECPCCHYYLSEDEHEFYCTECDYTKPMWQQINITWREE